MKISREDFIKEVTKMNFPCTVPFEIFGALPLAKIKPSAADADGTASG